MEKLDNAVRARRLTGEFCLLLVVGQAAALTVRLFPDRRRSIPVNMCWWSLGLLFLCLLLKLCPWLSVSHVVPIVFDVCVTLNRSDMSDRTLCWFTMF